METAIKTKKLSHKEKYGKLGTKGKKEYNPFQDGFFTCVPSKMPEGYNFALGFCTETVTEAIRKQETKFNKRRK